MTSGTTTIDGLAYAGSGTFDDLDRVLTATFPKIDPTNAAETPETVSFGYNDRTLLTSVAGASTYVTGASQRCSCQATEEEDGNRGEHRCHF